MIPEKMFGRTGHKSKRVIFGAVAFLEATPAEADATMEILLKHGINHIETARGYGSSEMQLGWVLPKIERIIPDEPVPVAAAKKPPANSEKCITADTLGDYIDVKKFNKMMSKTVDTATSFLTSYLSTTDS